MKETGSNKSRFETCLAMWKSRNLKLLGNKEKWQNLKSIRKIILNDRNAFFSCIFISEYDYFAAHAMTSEVKKQVLYKLLFPLSFYTNFYFIFDVSI